MVLACSIPPTTPSVMSSSRTTSPLMGINRGCGLFAVGNTILVGGTNGMVVMDVSRLLATRTHGRCISRVSTSMARNVCLAMAPTFSTRQSISPTRYTSTTIRTISHSALPPTTIHAASTSRFSNTDCVATTIHGIPPLATAYPIRNCLPATIRLRYE